MCVSAKLFFPFGPDSSFKSLFLFYLQLRAQAREEKTLCTVCRWDTDTTACSAQQSQRRMGTAWTWLSIASISAGITQPVIPGSASAAGTGQNTGKGQLSYDDKILKNCMRHFWRNMCKSYQTSSAFFSFSWESSLSLETMTEYRRENRHS